MPKNLDIGSRWKPKQSRMTCGFHFNFVEQFYLGNGFSECVYPKFLLMIHCAIFIWIFTVTIKRMFNVPKIYIKCEQILVVWSIRINLSWNITSNMYNSWRNVLRRKNDMAHLNIQAIPGYPRKLHHNSNDKYCLFCITDDRLISTTNSRKLCFFIASFIDSWRPKYLMDKSWLTSEWI